MIFWARPRFEWQMRTRTLSLGDRTHVIAVVDLLDSSGPGSGPAFPSAAWAKLGVAAAVEAVDAGADIVSLGTGPIQPGSRPTAFDEQKRLLPVLEGTLLVRPAAFLAVDLRHPETAIAAAMAGAEMVSVLSAGAWDEAMGETVARTRCGLVLRAARGRSRQSAAAGQMFSDEAEVIPETFSGLCERLMLAEAAGIDAARIAVDPSTHVGLDSMTRAAALLAGLSRLRQLGRPLLWTSETPGRKPLKTTDNPRPEPQEARKAAIAASQTAAILAGAHLLRVRDVAAARQAAAVADALLEQESRE